MALSACAPQASRTAGGYAPQPMAGQIAPPPPPRAKVAVLLPLTGPQAGLGQPLLNAAQLALFEQGDPSFEFLPRDTGGSPAGAASAARTAIQDGARVIVGPLTAQETAAVAGVARGSAIPVLPFTNDANQAGTQVWPLGITPVQQVRRLVTAGQAQGVQRFALAAPDGALGRQMATALRAATAELGLPQPQVEFYPAAAQPSLVAKDIAQKLSLMPDAPAEQRPGMLLLAESGVRARDFAGALTQSGVAMPPLRLAGHALWGMDDAMGQQLALSGAWFPGSDPAARSQFESRYEAAFGEKPSRIVGVAYDAAAIAARAMRGQGPNGTAQIPLGETVLGADGQLRLNPGGMVQRGLAVYAIAPGNQPGVVAGAELPGSVGF
ncbi:penicillin-binding protein activator [Teichococcus deserti]|uniref:penicillin-binding protein activator n=1 Tax=Teichococcus deserti TaxID=1817963 RepID=UPI0009F8CAE1|nr:penicillin-binding protein activator [Pseudoroseomonas deserti]